jgi:hypothetical protein
MQDVAGQGAQRSRIDELDVATLDPDQLLILEAP